MSRLNSKRKALSLLNEVEQLLKADLYRKAFNKSLLLSNVAEDLAAGE